MALLDVVIGFLNINCSVVQCSGYGSDIEALFYLLFFPTVFIILFVYVVVGAIINRLDGTPGALRLLISVALYAFIIFEGYYNLFVSLSKLWWLLLATLVGVWLFIRQFIHGGGTGGGPMSGLRGGRGMSGFISDKVKRKIGGEEEDVEKEIEDAFRALGRFYKEIKSSKGEGREMAVSKFREEQANLRSLITSYGNFGKMPILDNTVKLNVTKQSKKFWDRYGKWSEKFEKIE